MTDPRWQELPTFEEKIASYLATHRQIVAEFERSLRNSRHFIELAHVSREQEPESTLDMLEQIREIDLLGHVNTQFDAFREISDLLPEEAGSAAVLEARGHLSELQGRYESLLDEAEQQQEAIQEIISGLERPS